MKTTGISIAIALAMTIGCVPPQTYLKPSTILVNPVESKEGIFSDETISIRMSPAAVGVDLSIKNRSGKVMQVVWDRCAIIGPNAVSMRVIHGGITLSRKEMAQTPTVIAPDSQIEDAIFPSDNITLNDFSGWQHKGIFKESDVNGIFTILLAVDIEGQPKNYLFKFKILALV
jgi:hypothetical protein